tara:strand:+ start:308 stop:676 length:369 start_codon:yes stop_codon:yes gene_type:complete
MTYDYYKLIATNIDGDIELLYCSGIKADCTIELEDQKSLWKEEGYKGFKITTHATDVKPTGWTLKAIKDIKQGSVFVKTTSGAMFTRGEYDRQDKTFYCEDDRTGNELFLKGSKLVWASDYL